MCVCDEFQKGEISAGKEVVDEEAESGIMNLMKKDYPGGGGAHHRPPINNQEPLH